MEVLVGIDFGTTNTVISKFINNKSEIILDGIFKTIPSKIGYYNSKIYCGNYIPLNCNNIIHSFKIKNDNNKFILGENEYEYSEILIIFFNHIKDLIIKNLRLSNGIIKAVITVPSNFNDIQREKIKKAFENVNIKIIRLINEPSAAALAYGLNHSTNDNDNILVIDTGGGTMDFTVLEKTDMFFEVIHSCGLNNLGGNNFTNIISNDILKMNSLNEESINKNILWNVSQKIKEKLSYLDMYETDINNLISDKKIKYILSRTRFENISNQLLTQIEETLKEIINNYPNISYIILVGGSSRIPILQKTIKLITDKNPWIHPNLESVVAEGAALYAGIIENKYTLNDDILLLDVLPLSLGVELVDGTYSIIIPKNTPLPTKRTQKYTTDSPGETVIKIKVYQGDRKIASKNILIGEIIFDKVSISSSPIIEISFKVDVNSMITVIIVDKKTGVEKNVVIRNITDFNTEDINKLIEESNKFSDMDDTELSKIQNIYIIKTHIENALINLSINELILEEDKKIMLDKFKSIEDKVEEMNNLQLIETINFLQNNYNILNSNNISNKDDKLDDIEKVFLNENIQELTNKIKLLLIKNPEWEEFLNPVLEELSYNTVSMDYINDKINTINELENELNNNDKDYKQEVNNLCIYLKNELESGNINLDPNKNNKLIILINESLLLLSNNENINWEDYLNQINKSCEEIYNM